MERTERIKNDAIGQEIGKKKKNIVTSITKSKVKVVGHICQDIIDLSATYWKGSHGIK